MHKIVKLNKCNFLYHHYVIYIILECIAFHLYHKNLTILVKKNKKLKSVPFWDGDWKLPTCRGGNNDIKKAESFKKGVKRKGTNVRFWNKIYMDE